MIQVDKTDFLYKALQNLGVDDNKIDDEYITFANQGIINVKDFNNSLQVSLGMDYLGEVDEAQFEEVVDYYKDLKRNKKLPKSKLVELLKQYNDTKQEDARVAIINSQLREVLLIACAYKLRHQDINLSDLVQVCNIGLMVAVDKYKPDSKLTFEIYLNYWILKEIEQFTLGEQKNG